VVIRGNYIHDTATSGAYIKGGSEDGLIENNYIKNTGTGGAGGVNMNDPPNSGAGLMLGYQTDEEFFSRDNPGYVQTTNAIVRSNIIQNTADGGILVWGSQDAQIYNNTLYNVSTKPWYFGGGIGVSQISTYTDDGDVFTKSSNVTIQNNIVVVAGAYPQSPGYVTTAAISVSAGGVTGDIRIDHNVYHTLGGQGVKLFDAGNGEITLAQWQARFGGVDGHSVVANPQLDANLHLGAGSPAVNAGATIPGLTTDFDGRPTTGGPLDIGADQADAGPALPLPTTGSVGAGPSGPPAPAPGDTGGGNNGGGNGGGSGDGGQPPTPPTPGLPFVQLATPVAGVDGIYSGPDAQHVAPNGHIALHLVTPAFSDHTGGRLRIVEEPSGKVVGEIDFVRGDAYDGRQIVDIDLTPFNLKPGTSYSVVTTNDFLRVNAAPWQAGAIERGQWQFRTDGDAPAGGGDPGQPPPPPPQPPADEPMVFTKLGKAVAGVDGIWSGSDPHHVALDGHIALKLVTKAYGDYTGGRLRIVEEPSGKVVGEIDFKKGDAYDGKQVVDIDLGQFALKAGTTYSVVATNDFLRVNAAPWQAGAIARGEWQFTTKAGGQSAGAPVEPEDFAFPPPTRLDEDEAPATGLPGEAGGVHLVAVTPPVDPLAEHPPGMAFTAEGLVF
jgi:parallel beta-helix repeat protein